MRDFDSEELNISVSAHAFASETEQFMSVQKTEDRNPKINIQMLWKELKLRNAYGVL